MEIWNGLVEVAADGIEWVRENPVKTCAVLGVVVAAPIAFVAAPAIGAAVSAAGLGVAGGTLSGAAASSAGLAALGGGSLAAGGLGMAGGTAVATAVGGAVGGAAAAGAGAAAAALSRSHEDGPPVALPRREPQQDDAFREAAAALQASVMGYRVAINRGNWSEVSLAVREIAVQIVKVRRAAAS